MCNPWRMPSRWEAQAGPARLTGAPGAQEGHGSGDGLSKAVRGRGLGPRSRPQAHGSHRARAEPPGHEHTAGSNPLWAGCGRGRGCVCHGTGSREKSQKHRTVRPVKQLVSKPGEPPPRPGLLPQVRADKLRSDPGVLVRSGESKFHCSRAGTGDQQSDVVHALPFADGSSVAHGRLRV